MPNAFTASGLFGSVFSDQSIRSEFKAESFQTRMLAFEQAWTKALLKTGVISAEDAAAALKAIKTVKTSILSAGSDQDGLPVPALVRELKKELPEGAGAAIHKGATSQDVIDSAMSLTLIAVSDILEQRLMMLTGLLKGLLDQFGDRPLMARTRMQAALPSKVSLRVNAWKRPLEDHLKRLSTVRDEVCLIQAGGGTGQRNLPEGHADEVAAFVAKEMGLRLTPVWHNDRSAPVLFGSWLSLVCGSCGKIGQDLVLMAQQGVDEISFKGGGGSSAMPHKQNPIEAEAMISLARFVSLQQALLNQAMIHEQERSGAAWALEWLTLPAMAEATGASLNHALNILSRVNKIGT